MGWKNGTGSLTIVDSGMPNYSDWHFDSLGAITTYAVVHLAGYKSVGGGW